MKIKKPLALLSFISALAICACSGAKHPLKMETIRKEAEEEEYNGDLTIKAVAFESMGDCTLVQLDDIDILIDCGGDNTNMADKNGHDKVCTFLNENIKDDTLDYVIITHQDLDHTNAFFAADGGGLPGWLSLPSKKIGTLIDFDSTMDSTVDGWKFKSIHYKNPTLYSEPGLMYQIRRNLWIKEKKIEQYYTASQLCYKKRIENKNLSSDKLENMKADIEKNNSKLASGKLRFPSGEDDDFNTFKIKSASGASAKLIILYNEFNSKNDLEVKLASNGKDVVNRSVVVNQMSVCSLIEYGDDKFLFTGDLEEFDSATSASGCKRIYGETKLIDNNREELEGGVMFYRGGHHGSKTSSSAYFCSVIRPQYVYWTGVAGISPGGNSSDESRFPAQNAINNVGRYTDKIYYSMCDGRFHGKTAGSIDKLYGAVTFTYSPKKAIGEKMKVSYETPEGSSKEPNSFFLSSFMKKHDDRSVPVYIYNLTANVPSNYPIDCSYIKIGHIDILIGAGQLGTGSVGNTYKTEIVGKIKHLCNDKVLDYLIIPTNNLASYGFLIGKKGLLADKDIVIKNIYHGEFKNEEAKQLKEALGDLETTVIKKEESINVFLDKDYEGEKSNITINFLDSDYSIGTVWDRSLLTLVSAFGLKYLNLGHNTSYNISESNNSLIKDKIDVLQMPRCGYLATEDEAQSFYDFASHVSSTVSTHNYQGAKDEDGIVALLNTTFNKNKDGVLAYPSKHLFIRNSNDDEQESRENTAQDSALTYKKNGNVKRVLMFSTLKNVGGDDKCVSFNSEPTDGEYTPPNGDLCLRAWVYPFSIRIGVAPNYSAKEQELLFNDVSGTMKKELSTGLAKELTLDSIMPLLTGN